MNRLILFIALLTTALSCKESNEGNSLQANVDPPVLGLNFENPYEYIGIEHNNLLAHLINIQSNDYTDAVNYVANSLNENPNNFLPYSSIQNDFSQIMTSPDNYLFGLALPSQVMQVLSQVSNIIYQGNNVSQQLDNLALSTSNASGLSTQNRDMLMAAIALAKHSNAFWEENEDTQAGLSDKWKKRIADLSGFTAGFLGALTYNNNNGSSGIDVNPFSSGAAVGGLASKAFGD